MNNEYKELQALLNQEEGNLTAYGQERINELQRVLGDWAKMPEDM